MTPSPTRTADRGAGFGAVLAFEWSKAWTARALRWTLVATALVTPVFAVFVGLTESLQPDDTVLGGSLTGVAQAQVLAAVVGALVMSTEHSTATITTTLLAVPRRRTVLAAKAVLVAGVTTVVGLVSAVVAHQIGRVLLDDGGYAPGEPMPALLGVAACIGATGLAGLALGTVLRHSAGAVAAGFAVVTLPALVAPVLGDLQRWVAGASPLATLQKLTQSSDATPETMGSLGAWPSLAVTTVAALVALAAAARRFAHSDA